MDHDTGPARVAICISGELRTFDKTSALIEERLVRPNNHSGLRADVFAHVYAAADDLVLAHLHAVPWIKTVEVERYGPAIERELRCNEPSWCRANTTLSMLRKIKLCSDMIAEHERQHGFTYDYIVRTRPDLVPGGPIRADSCEPQRLCIPGGLYMLGPRGSDPAAHRSNCPTVDWGCDNCCRACSDIFAFGPSNLMKTYAAIYDVLDHLTPEHPSAVWPEHLMFSALRFLNLSQAVVRAPWLRGAYLQRSNGVPNKPM